MRGLTVKMRAFLFSYTRCWGVESGAKPVLSPTNQRTKTGDFGYEITVFQSLIFQRLSDIFSNNSEKLKTVTSGKESSVGFLTTNSYSIGQCNGKITANYKKRVSNLILICEK